jgi:hypothetical protein
VRDVKASRVQGDEIWSFIYGKQKNVAAAKSAPDHSGVTPCQPRSTDQRLFKEGRKPRPCRRASHEYYNFVRIYKTLRVTPTMEAGVADRLWDIADIAIAASEIARHAKL